MRDSLPSETMKERSRPTAPRTSIWTSEKLPSVLDIVPDSFMPVRPCAISALAMSPAAPSIEPSPLTRTV